MSSLNFRPTDCFWVVANERGFARAAQRLGLALQTIGVQVRLLEQHRGHHRRKPSGRRVAVIEAWQVTLQRAVALVQRGKTLMQDAPKARRLHYE